LSKIIPEAGNQLTRSPKIKAVEFLNRTFLRPQVDRLWKVYEHLRTSPGLEGITHGSASRPPHIDLQASLDGSRDPSIDPSAEATEDRIATLQRKRQDTEHRISQETFS
jgi:hypothetical protein